MTNAIHDENRVIVWLAASYLDGVTPVPIQINSSNGGIAVDEVHTIGFTPSPIDPRDKNFRGFILAQGDDGLTYPLFADPVTGGILIDT